MLDERTITVTAFDRVTWRRRVRRVILTLFSVLVLLTVGAGAAYMAFSNRADRINFKHEALLPAPGVTLSPGESVPTKDPAAKDAENILLIGSDSRGPVAEGRSDLIVLMHISDDRKKVHLVRFPRDLSVSVPGLGKDKINAVYAYGGAPMLVRSLQNLLDVRIDRVAVISFEGLRDMTDALGGVDVYAERAIALQGFGTVRKGVNHLNGSAALEFIRERPKESDATQGRRALAFVKALMLTSLSKDSLGNPIARAAFIDAAVRTVTLDDEYSTEDIRSQVSALQDLGTKDLVTLTAPVSGAGTGAGVGTGATGISVKLVTISPLARLSIALRSDDLGSFPVGRQFP